MQSSLQSLNSIKQLTRWLKTIQETNLINQVNLLESLMTVKEILHGPLTQHNIDFGLDIPQNVYIECLKNDWFSIITQLIEHIINNLDKKTSDHFIRVHYNGAKKPYVDIIFYTSLVRAASIEFNDDLLGNNNVKFNTKTIEGKICYFFNVLINTKDIIPRIAIWDDVYKLGIPLIDDQHMGLFDAINELHYALVSRDNIKILSLIEMFEEYTKKHFGEEEQLMRDIAYPKINEHIIQHEMFKNKIQDLKEQANDHQNPLEKSSMLFFRDWLFIHIKIHDKEYMEYNRNA